MNAYRDGVENVCNVLHVCNGLESPEKLRTSDLFS
jgi:hypothetical protein